MLIFCKSLEIFCERNLVCCWKVLVEFIGVGGNWKKLAVEPNDFLNGFVDGSGSMKRWDKEKQWMEAWER